MRAPRSRESQGQGPRPRECCPRRAPPTRSRRSREAGEGPRVKRPQHPDAAQCRAAVTLRGGYHEIKSRRPWNRCGLSSLVLVRGGRAESLRRRTHVGKIPPWDAHGRVDPVTARSPARPSSGRPVGPRPSPAPSGTWGSAGRGGRVGAWRVPRVSAGRGALVASSQEFRVRWHAARTPRDPLGPTAPPL